jgi:carboxyl-terminal processing protease
MRLRLGSVCAAIVLTSGAGGALFGDRVLAGGGKLSDHLRLYTTALAAIQDQYAEEVTSDRLVSASIREMLRTLDPHSNFLETKEYSSLQERQRGSYYGLGVTVQSGDGNISVVAVFEGTPAYRLGIRPGDIISRIESEDARGMSIDDAVKRLRGPKGSPVHIWITRQGYDAPLEFTVIRDEIPLHSVPYLFMATKTTGYIRLTDFNETTACRPSDPRDCERELEKALRKLKESGATSFILDIRDNPGGLLDQAFAVSNLFLKKGQLVVYTRGRFKRDESNYITEQESPYVAAPLVVLVSRHSASASEIVAGAIQDHDRGLIVGETTFGKGLVQTILPLHNVRGYALALTTGRYYTPSGRSIQRDYGSTALEDYVSPLDRTACEQGSGEPKLTDVGRKVYGGDGITPDYCAEAAKPSKLVAHLIARQAFLGFSRGFASAETTTGGAVSGSGQRPEMGSGKVHLIRRDFQADASVLAEFRAFLETRKIRYDAAELEAEREAVLRQITDQVLWQAFGEEEARKRSVGWDPQLRRALELVPRAEMLLRDPQRYVAERASEQKVAAAPSR